MSTVTMMTGRVRVLVLMMLISIFCSNVEGFGVPRSFGKTNRVSSRSIQRKYESHSATSLSSTPLDFAQTSIFISAQLEAYEKQGVPDIVLPLIVSLIVGTILLPLTARKFQKDRNTRSIKNSKIQQEPEDAAGAYEKFYKINAPEEGRKL